MKSEGLMLSILVVLYNCRLSDSQTLKAINECLDADQWACVNIHIFNNGPVYLNKNFDFPLQANKQCSVKLHQDINNVPLSRLYNQFIPAEGIYLLLDQDTELTFEYFKSLVTFAKSNVNIFVPRLEHPGHKTYPICNTELNEGVMEVPKIFSALSGLALKKSIIQEVIARYGNLFDARFAFYGVDSTFFVRLNSMKICNYYIGPFIHHDLSGGLSLKQIDSWRYRERAIDLALQLRNYPSLRCCGAFMSFFKGSSKISFLKALPAISKVLVTGKHPRCR